MDRCGLCDSTFRTYDELVEHDTKVHGFTHNNYALHHPPTVKMVDSNLNAIGPITIGDLLVIEPWWHANQRKARKIWFDDDTHVYTPNILAEIQKNEVYYAGSDKGVVQCVIPFRAGTLEIELL